MISLESLKKIILHTSEVMFEYLAVCIENVTLHKSGVESIDLTAHVPFMTSHETW